MRRARFRLAERRGFDGSDLATVTIQIGGGSALFAVRPYRRRRPFELPLSTVAQLVITRVALQRARERLAARKGRRS